MCISVFNIVYKFKIVRSKYLFLWCLFLSMKRVQKGVYRNGVFFYHGIILNRPRIVAFTLLKTPPKTLRWSILQEQSTAKNRQLSSQDTPSQMFYSSEYASDSISHIKDCTWVCPYGRSSNDVWNKLIQSYTIIWY